MFFSNKNYCAAQHAVAIAGFCLALLTGCSDDNRKKASSSSVSSSVSSSSAPSSSSSNSSSSKSPLANSPEVGHWYAPAYGYVLSVSAEGGVFTVNTYSVTENYCMLQNVDANLPLDDFKQKYIYSNVAREALLESKGVYPPGIEYEKVKQLPVVCEGNLQKVKTDSGYSFDARKDFEILWEAFDELYINFELRGVNWDEAYEEAVNIVGDIKNEDELFEFFSVLIAPLGDAHAVLVKLPLTHNIEESLAAARGSDATQIFQEYTQLTLHEKLLNEYLEAIEPDIALTDAQIAAAEEYILVNVDRLRDVIFDYARGNSDIEVRAAGEIAWFKTNDNIGYLFIGSMSDYSEGISTIVSDLAIAETTINDALKDLAGTSGLIIDVRFNTGGEDQVALNFVRHFMSQPQVVFSKSSGSGAWATPKKEVVLDPQTGNSYLKPTAVLVSGDTVSAAEIFTIAMSSLPQVAIIGEPTAGALSDILVKRLTSDILFGISNETYLDTQGNNYERIGIPADIAVPFGTLQEREGGYDAGIDAAIDWIKSVP